MTGHSLSLGALGALGYAGLGSAIPQHGPEAALATPGDTRVVTVYEFLGPTGVWARISPRQFVDLEDGFRATGDANSLTSKLRWGDEQQVVAEVRWANRALSDPFWFGTTPDQWALYTKEGIIGDPRGLSPQGAACKESSSRWRNCKIVKNWRADGTVAWQHPTPDVMSDIRMRIERPQGRLALYLGLAALGFFGWRVYQGREGGRASA